MAVYYKFKSVKDYETIPIDGHFISVGNLKQKIFKSKHLGRGTDFDLVITNAQTNEEYSDESTLIAKNTAVLIRRVPGMPRMPIVVTRVTEEGPKLENELEYVQPQEDSFSRFDSLAMKLLNDSEWDEFGDDLYSIPEALPVQSGNQVQDAPFPSKTDEDSKIKALIDTPVLDWQSQPGEGFGPGQGFGQNAQMMNNRNFVRPGFERKTPPPGYVCHRCKVPGHFIQHCPTNGDPKYDIKKVKPPTGIPKSMLVPTPNGSYVLSSGAAAVLKPNEAAFEKEIEGLPSTRSIADVPPELRCPLCKEVMKDAVLTSKCCLKSFCDKCIRDTIISNSMCACGGTNVLTDDLLPNKTLRDTINRILESSTSSPEKSSSAYQVQDMESHNPRAKIPSPTQSVASKSVQELPAPPHREEGSKMQETAEEGKNVSALTQETEKEKAIQVADVFEAINESISGKEPAPQGSTVLPDEEMQQKPAIGDAGTKTGKKNKKMKVRVPLNEMQWRMAQDLAAENYMMSMGLAAYNAYWGLQPGIEGFLNPYAGGMPYMSYGGGPLDVPQGGVLPHDPFGGQGLMMPFGPQQRDLAKLGMGFNAGPPLISRDEFEACKADLKGREMERRGGESRDSSKDGELDRAKGSGDVSLMKSKYKTNAAAPSSDHHRHRPERLSPMERRSQDPQLSRLLSKRKRDYDGHRHHRDHRDDYRRHGNHHNYDDDGYHKGSSGHHSGSSSSAAKVPTSVVDKKHESSVFSCKSISEGDTTVAFKKWKLSSSGVSSTSCSMSHKELSNGHHYYEDQKASKKRSAPVSSVYNESSDDHDDDRHFKRRPSRHEASLLPVWAALWERWSYQMAFKSSSITTKHKS